METTTSEVEFSFNDTVCWQTDGVAIRSPLGAALVDTFVGYQVTKLFLNVKKPLMYYRYVNDTFALFEIEDKCKNFCLHSNLLHCSLCFKFKKQLKFSLTFLNVLAEIYSLLARPFKRF